jgi:hypothetical protein
MRRILQPSLLTLVEGLVSPLLPNNGDGDALQCTFMQVNDEPGRPMRSAPRGTSGTPVASLPGPLPSAVHERSTLAGRCRGSGGPGCPVRGRSLRFAALPVCPPAWWPGSGSDFRRLMCCTALAGARSGSTRLHPLTGRALPRSPLRGSRFLCSLCSRSTAQPAARIALLFVFPRRAEGPKTAPDVHEVRRVARLPGAQVVPDSLRFSQQRVLGCRSPVGPGVSLRLKSSRVRTVAVVG